MTTEPIVTPPAVAPAESPFATTRLPDLPPTVRLQVRARGWTAWWRQAWPALLVGAGLALALVSLALWRPAAAPPRALLVTVAPVAATATPAIELPIEVAQVAPPAPAPRIIAYWSPNGETYGEVELAGAVDVIEQYRGWVRFTTPHMAGDLWAPIAALAELVPVERLAAVPEIAATPHPATATPATVYVAAPADLAAIPPTAPVISEAGNIVLEDTAERYEVQRPTAAGAEPQPTPGWGGAGGGGGGWDE